MPPGEDRPARVAALTDRALAANSLAIDYARGPARLGGVAGLPKLVDALRDAGYRDGTLDKLTHANWLRVLDATWSG